MRTRHTQHHESLRSNSTNIAIAVSAAMPGLIAADVTSDERWVLTGFLMLVNVYRLVMSLKHNERSKLHRALSRRYREVVSEVSVIDSHSINDMRSVAHSEHHARNFPARRVGAYWMCGVAYTSCSLYLVQGCCGAIGRIDGKRETHWNSLPPPVCRVYGDAEVVVRAIPARSNSSANESKKSRP